jgi:IPT/TIG domain
VSRRQQRRRIRRRRESAVSSRSRAISVGAGALAAALVPAAAAQAQTIQVTNLNDTGAGSLRAAITTADSDATSSAAPDLITFQSGLSGSIELATPLPVITDSIDILGRGARTISLDASAIPGGTNQAVIGDSTGGSSLLISGLSMKSANTGVQKGGFIYDSHGRLELDGDQFSGDTATGYGGAVAAYQSQVIVQDSTFAADTARYQGGGLWVRGGSLSMNDSTVTDGYAHNFGGGVFLSATTATVTGSTIDHNAVDYGATGIYSGPDGYGGGIALHAGATLTLMDSILAGDSASGNAHASGGPQDHRDVYGFPGTTISAAFSLIQYDTASLGAALDSTDIAGEDPMLGSLGNNGGPTDTEAPLAGSPVINAGESFGLMADQRGDARPVEYPGSSDAADGDGADIGAVELQLATSPTNPPTPPPPSPPPSSPTPAVGRLSRRAGTRGDQLTITGTGFSHATAVAFGGTRATGFTVVDDSEITATVPAGGGTVDVRVTAAGRTSAVAAADRFTYVAPALTAARRVRTAWRGAGVLVDTGFTVACPSGGDGCHASVSAHATVPVSLARVRRRHTKVLSVGALELTATAGQSKRLVIVLNKPALKALKRLKRLRVTIEITATEAAGTVVVTKTVTIRQPRKRH